VDYLSDQYDMFTEAASKTLSSQRASKSLSLPSLNATVTAGKYGTPGTLVVYRVDQLYAGRNVVWVNKYYNTE